MNVGGSPKPLPIISKKKKKDLEKCIICQNSKDKKGESKLTCANGRNVITEASKSLKDDLLHGLRDADITNIKYHVNTCYANYRKKKERSELTRNNDTSNSTTFFANTGTLNPTCSREELRRLVIKSHM